MKRSELSVGMQVRSLWWGRGRVVNLDPVPPLPHCSVLFEDHTWRTPLIVPIEDLLPHPEEPEEEGR